MLTNEWLNNGEGFTRTRSTNNPSRTERIDNIHKSLAEFTLVIIPHRDVDTILVLDQLLTLLEGFVLKIETVFQQTLLQELTDIVKSDMYKYRSKDGCSHIEPDVQSNGIETCVHTCLEQPYRDKRHNEATNQMRGGVSSELSRLRNQLLHLTSLMELELDFSEEDVEFVSREELRSLALTIEDRIAHLADSFQTGNAIKNGVTVAIVGAPNVGKSTLLNALLKEEKAIVSEVQGTTRDVIEDVIQIEGITFRFFDTAGIRKTTDRIEQMGIDRTLQTLSRAQIVLLLSEKGIDFPHLDIPEDKVVLRVVNKSDITHPQNSFIFNKVSPGGYIHISALTGAGMPLLTHELIKAAAVPEINGNEPIITSLRHYESLTLARSDIHRVLDALQNQIPCDLVSQDLRQCLHHLAEITGGEITSDDVLGSIFSSFCIGK